MSTDTFVVYSTAYISHEEYTGWLRQLNAVMTPEESGGYDARLSKDIRHVWISLLDKKWFDMYMAESKDQPEVLAKIRQLLGGEPRSAIVLDTSDAIGSKILAVEFAALCAEHYPCVVLQTVGDVVYSGQELFQYRDAGMGFDGFTWETADPDYDYSFLWDGLEVRDTSGDASKDQIFVRSNRSEERNRVQLGAYTLFSTARILLDEYTDWLHQLNAVITPDSPEDARLSKNVCHVWINLLNEEWFDTTLAEFADQPEVLVRIRQLLDGEPQSAILLIANGVVGSKILAVQFAALCADHYPCVVLQTVGDVVYSRQELLKYRDAGMGFDGFTWETADPGYSFLPDGLEFPAGSEDSLKNQLIVRSSMLEERHKEQLGA